MAATVPQFPAEIQAFFTKLGMWANRQPLRDEPQQPPAYGLLHTASRPAPAKDAK